MSVRRTYETTLIINAALEDPDIEAAVNKVATNIENLGGEIKEIEKWGRKRLAYPINKKYNGYYVHYVFDANSNVMPEFERFLTLDDTILRHLTLVLPDKLREFRAKRAAVQAEAKAKAQTEAPAKEETEAATETDKEKTE